MTQSEYIISKFGGINALARALGKSPSTVQVWKEAGSIRECHWREILDAAEAGEIELAPEDFVQHLRRQEVNAA